MPVHGIKPYNLQLQNQIGTSLWRGDTERFAVHGTQEALFLIPDRTIKKHWFPTSVPTQSSDFKLVLTHNQREFYVTFENEKLNIVSEAHQNHV